MDKNFKELVLEQVRKIPEGNVATYGQIAYLVQKSKIKNQKYKSKFKISSRFVPRLVGFILHQNKDPKTSCHRVVDRNGRLAPNFAFDGAAEQRRRLEAENVKFRDKMHVDLKSCLWQS